MAGGKLVAMRFSTILGNLISPRIPLAWAVLAAGVAGSVPAQAQATGAMPLTGQSAGFYSAITKLFGNTTGFSAKAEMTAKEKSGAEIVRLTMGFAVLDGKIRMDIDLDSVKSAGMTASEKDRMRKMGMGQVTMVIRPDKQATLLIYPSLKSYVETPMTEEDKMAYSQAPKIEKTVIGNEKIDGHPCVKNKLVITEPSGKVHVGSGWMATDLKEFPLQTQFAELDTEVLMRYRNVQFTRPEPDRFDPPAGYARFNDVQQFIQFIMEKMKGGSAKPPRR